MSQTLFVADPDLSTGEFPGQNERALMLIKPNSHTEQDFHNESSQNASNIIDESPIQRSKSRRKSRPSPKIESDSDASLDLVDDNQDSRSVKRRKFLEEKYHELESKSKKKRGKELISRRTRAREETHFRIKDEVMEIVDSSEVESSDASVENGHGQETPSFLKSQVMRELRWDPEIESQNESEGESESEPNMSSNNASSRQKSITAKETQSRVSKHAVSFEEDSGSDYEVKSEDITPESSDSHQLVEHKNTQYSSSENASREEAMETQNQLVLVKKNSSHKREHNSPLDSEDIDDSSDLFAIPNENDHSERRMLPAPALTETSPRTSNIDDSSERGSGSGSEPEPSNALTRYEPQELSSPSSSTKEKPLIFTRLSSAEDDLSFACSACPHRARNKGQIKKHHEGHEQKRKLKCFYCDWTANRFDYLDSHMDFHEEYKGIRQDVREKSYLNKKSRGVVGSDDFLKFPCDECDQAFRRKEHLQSHRLSHTQNSYYKCEDCEKVLKRKSDLESHKKVCSKEPLRCVRCDKLFDTKTKLRQHEEIHFDLSCVYCGRSFKSSRALGVHKRHKHKGERNDSEDESEDTEENMRQSLPRQATQKNPDQRQKSKTKKTSRPMVEVKEEEDSSDEVGNVSGTITSLFQRARGWFV